MIVDNHTYAAKAESKHSPPWRRIFYYLNYARHSNIATVSAITAHVVAEQVLAKNE